MAETDEASEMLAEDTEATAATEDTEASVASETQIGEEAAETSESQAQGETSVDTDAEPSLKRPAIDLTEGGDDGGHEADEGDSKRQKQDTDADATITPGKCKQHGKQQKTAA